MMFVTYAEQHDPKNILSLVVAGAHLRLELVLNFLRSSQHSPWNDPP